MYDEAYKKQPGDEELGAQTFMANAKIGNWKVAQQVNITRCLSYCVRHRVQMSPYMKHVFSGLSFLTLMYVHQVSTRMHKNFKDDRFLYWSVMAAVLQVRMPAPWSRAHRARFLL